MPTLLSLIVVLNRTVVVDSDWRFDNLWESKSVVSRQLMTQRNSPFDFTKYFVTG